MSEIGKIELDDDELDKVSGGARANVNQGCIHCSPLDTSIPNSCDNCANNNGLCPYK